MFHYYYYSIFYLYIDIKSNECFVNFIYLMPFFLYTGDGTE